MNLQFTTVREEIIDGRPYALQKADVTGDPQFWSRWRMCSDAMRARVMLRSEDAGSGKRGGARWFAYRYLPLDGSGNFPTFALTYSMRNTDRLLPYQPRAVAHLCQSITVNGAALDGSDTGLGKTYVALKCAELMCLRPAIVCKIAGIAVWKEACAYMGIEPLFIVNWEKAKGRSFKYVHRRVDEWNGEVSYVWDLPDNTLIIYDEAHVANHRGSQNYALYVASRGHASIACSATFGDRIARLRGFLHVVAGVAEEQFTKWCTDRGCFVNDRNEEESLTDQADMVEVNKWIFPRYGYRLSYNDPDVKTFFPDVSCQTLLVTLSKKATAEHRSLYAKMVTQAEKYKAMGMQAEVLVADLRYRQAAELLKGPTIADLTINYIEEGHSVCVFVNFRETMYWLADRLNTRSLIYGNQHVDHLSRENVIREFQSDRSRVIICMAEAGGQSINLHDVTGRHRRVSLICPTYNPITIRQIMGRTRRAGSKSVPVIKLVYAAGTVEAKVAQRVNTKLDNIAALHDGDLMEPDTFRLGVRH